MEVGEGNNMYIYLMNVRDSTWLERKEKRDEVAAEGL